MLTWITPKYSLTICGTFLPLLSIKLLMISSNWQTCWGTALSTRPGSICLLPAPSICVSWKDWDWWFSNRIYPLLPDPKHFYKIVSNYSTCLFKITTALSEFSGIPDISAHEKSGRSTSVLAAFSACFRNMEKCIDFLTTLFEGPVIRNLLWENGNRG